MVGCTSQKINVEKQKGEYTIFICWLFLPSVEQIRSFRGNLHAWEVCSFGESLEEIWMAGTCDKPRIYDSASVVGQISAIYTLSWEIVPSWTKNIKYNFRLLASHDIISIVAEKVLNTHPETTSMEQSVNNVLKRLKAFFLPSVILVFLWFQTYF